VLAAPPVGADSFTPVTLAITVAPVARLHQPLKITVAIGADAGVLDTRTAPLRVRVKLATECGGAYAYTTGTVLLDRELSPQPATGEPYAARATGSGKPTSYGVQTVCVYLEEEGDNRQFATDTSNQVDVSKQCTVRAGSYDGALRALARARRELRRARASNTRARLRRLVAKRGATARTDRRATLKACGSGVPL
jgi:hypothetical protein